MMQHRGISKLDLKRQNRMQILNIIKQRGATSRIDIAESLELTRAAVTIITNEMIEQGVLVEAGTVKYTQNNVPKGRKKILIDINQNYKLVLGLTITEQYTSLGFSSLNGSILDKKNFSYDKNIIGSSIIDFAVSGFKDILSSNCLLIKNVLGIGIAVEPGMYKVLGIECNIDGTPNYSNVCKLFKMKTKLPVIIGSSITAIAMANSDYQEGIKNIDNFVLIKHGTFINMMPVHANQPLDVYTDCTRQIERMIVNPSGNEWEDYPRGSVKAELSAAAMLNKVRSMYSKENTPVLYQMTDGNVMNSNLINSKEAYLRGDQGINEIYKKSAQYLGILFNNISVMSMPQKIILHNFQLTASEFEVFKKMIAETVSVSVADLLMISVLDVKNCFLAGCSLATREFFFNRGGYDLESDSNDEIIMD